MRRGALFLTFLVATPGCAALPRRAPPRAPAAPAYAAPYVSPPAYGPPAWPAPEPAPPRATSAPALAVAFAEEQVGKPYCRGGEGPRCFDCSGLVQAAWARAGVMLPRTSDDLVRRLDVVSAGELLPGDILWWPGHVGLYVGEGQIVDARGVRAGVVRRALHAAPARVLRPGG